MLNREQRFPWEIHLRPPQPAYKSLALKEFFHFAFSLWPELFLLLSHFWLWIYNVIFLEGVRISIYDILLFKKICCVKILLQPGNKKIASQT